MVLSLLFAASEAAVIGPLWLLYFESWFNPTGILTDMAQQAGLAALHVLFAWAAWAGRLLLVGALVHVGRLILAVLLYRFPLADTFATKGHSLIGIVGDLWPTLVAHAAAVLLFARLARAKPRFESFAPTR